MSSIVIAGDTSGTCTLQANAVAGTVVLTLPTTSGTLVSTTTPINASSITSGTLAVAYGGTGGNDAPTARTNLGLGTIATQNANNVSITGGTVSANGSGLTAINASNVSAGTLAVAQGGTGQTSLTANNVILGNGTSAVQVVAPGTSGNVLTSNGTTWASTAPAAIGVGQTWQDVTGSRTWGTNYTNSTGKPIEVAFSYTAASGSTVSAIVGGITIQANGVHAATERDSMTFIVPNGVVYQVARTGGDTQNIWAELR